MSKNVNNDVSKDSPISTTSLTFLKKMNSGSLAMLKENEAILQSRSDVVKR